MEIKIEKFDNLGNGICHINNKIIFVKRALPNEVLDINIYKEKTVPDLQEQSLGMGV